MISESNPAGAAGDCAGEAPRGLSPELLQAVDSERERERAAVQRKER
jgi:hypothetical protein